MQSSIRLISVLALLLLFQGCNSRNKISETSTDKLQPTQTNASAQSNKTDSFKNAVNTAMEAANQAKTAKASEEWTKVADTWYQAINLMKTVPASSTNYETAQQKVVEYQRNLEEAQHNSAASPNVVQQAEQPPKQEMPISQISQQAAKVRTGMTYREVVALLGRMPDSIINDQIRQELGEPTEEHNLITFEWKNDNPACTPVSVEFNPSDMTSTGVDEGRTCKDSSISNEPFGKPCAETTLCNLR